MKEIVNLEPITLSLLYEIRDRIVEYLKPDRIILFGSAIKLLSEQSEVNNLRESHDVDLYIIKKDLQNVREVERKIDELFAGRLFALDVIVRTPEQIKTILKSGNSFLSKQILSKGKILYDKKHLETKLS